jgi:hypothetical protein
MRRFITFIDAVYESKSLLLVLADSDPIKLLQIDDETRKTAAYDEVSCFYFLTFLFLMFWFPQIFAFDRTISRLLEMQSTDYVKKSLETFHQGQDYLGNNILTEIKVKSKVKQHPPSHPPHHNIPHPIPISESSHSQLHYHHSECFHNDQTSLLWVMRKLWSHYRLGTLDELQASSTIASSSSSSSSLSQQQHSLGSLIANETKQYINKESFYILLGDIIDYYFRDMNPSNDKQQQVMNYLMSVKAKHAKEKNIIFSNFVTMVLDLISLIHC